MEADDDTVDAARVMQAHAVRRLRSWTGAGSSVWCRSGTWPLSQGEDSALADISAADPNESPRTDQHATIGRPNGRH